MERISAILACAGKGERLSRFLKGKPKQFVYLLDKPIYMWSLLALLKNERIDTVVVVAPQDQVDFLRRELEGMAQSEKIRVTTGGASRQESVYAGLKFLSSTNPEPEFVLIHDAARPFLTQEMIDTTIDTVAMYGACTIGIAVSDTLKKVSDGKIVQTVDRSGLWSCQTPQAGRFDWLLDAHADAAKKNVNTTDDAGILESSGHAVKIIPGASYNIKITEPDDLALAEAFAPVFASSKSAAG